jgi:hypothetical protein
VGVATISIVACSQCGQKKKKKKTPLLGSGGWNEVPAAPRVFVRVTEISADEIALKPINYPLSVLDAKKTKQKQKKTDLTRRFFFVFFSITNFTVGTCY